MLDLKTFKHRFIVSYMVVYGFVEAKVSEKQKYQIMLEEHLKE